MPFANTNLPIALRSFLDCGLILDPWLEGLTEECFSFDSQDVIAKAADGLAGAHWREPTISETMGARPALRSLGRRAIHEVLASTAAAISHERVGRISVDAAMAEEAVRRLERFIALRGFGAMVWVFIAVTATENQGALAYYRQIAETEFVAGLRHRPWARGPLDDELVVGLAARTYRIVVRDGRRWVVGTAAGRRMLAEARRMLADSGFLAERLRLTWLSHFSVSHDLDRFVAAALPGANAQRFAFTAFAGVRPGMAVLDVGCGTAGQIFEGGLWAAVGPKGRVVGLDPAIGMIERSRRKAEAHQARNVEFVQGRAEALPYPKARFDATVALGALEYTDVPRAVVEMVRVTRPGGVVAAGGVVQGRDQPPAVRRWLAPVLRLAKRYGIEAGSRVGLYEHLDGTLADAGLSGIAVTQGESPMVLSDPELTARMLVQSGGFVQEVLERLPWAARQDVIRELEESGRSVCARTSPEERTMLVQTRFVRGVVPDRRAMATPATPT